MKSYRAEKVKGTFGMGYGYDRFCGNFIQIWQLKDPKKSLDWLPNQPDEENIIIDEDETIRTLSKREMIRIAANEGFKLTFKDLENRYE